MFRRSVAGILAVLGATMIFPESSSSNSDNLALLSDTLKTMQRAACDDEIVSLSCPRGTSISIQVAQYGKTAPRGHACLLERSQLHPMTVEVVGEEDCLWPNSMQYSLLQTVVEACQKKVQCKFSTTPKSLVDPCPATRKFVEVAYKCRPYEFRSRTGCEDDVIKLSCNPYSRVAIFDAQYGRTAYESIQCPQTQGVPDETCTSPNAVKTVMQLCHGKRRCQVSANSKTFRSPCRASTRTYLRIIYTCVPLGVLSERYENATERDEVRDVNSAIQGYGDKGLFDESDGPIERWDELSTVPPAPAVVANPGVLPPLFDDVTHPPRKANKPEENSIRTSKKDSESNGKIFIYVGVGVGVFIILVILLIGVRCYIIRRDARKTKAPDMFHTEVPNVFNDTISDIDNDIDFSHISGTFYDPVHPDMILYRDSNSGGKGTLRAMRPLSTIYPCAGTSMYGNVDYIPPQPRESTNRYRDEREQLEFEPEVVVSPKSLGKFSNTQFYYG